MQTILLIEDSEDDAIITQATLKKAGVLNPVKVVANGAKAIAYLKGEGDYADRTRYPLPSLMLLDLKLPKKAGFEVLEWWKSQPQLKKILVVVLSGYSDLHSVNRAYALGAHSFLIKPCKVEDIMNLRQAFTGSWNHSAPQGFPGGKMELPGSRPESG